MIKRRKKLLTSLISVTLVISLLLASGCGKQPEPQQNEEVSSSEAESAQQADVTVTAEPSSKAENETEAEDETAENSTEEASTEEVSESAPQTTQEIVAYFNTAANKIKTSASKVTKNYEKRRIDKDKTEIPGALEDFADTMVTKLMGDDTEPIVLDTREEIMKDFLVPEQSYVSILEPEWVEKASCVDNGDTYYIHLKLKPHKNPTSGVGVGAVCDVIETVEITSKLPFAEEFSTSYYDCEIKATIDKQTGRVVYINYIAPLVLYMRMNLFGTHSGSVGLSFEKDYTITY